nr:MAG TPA: holin [Caudoviricetes sp.]
MKHRIFFLSILSIFSFFLCIPVMAEVLPESDPGGVDYGAVFGSLAAIVAVIPVIVEAVKGFFPKMPSIVIQILSWIVGIGICMFGWWQHLGFLDDLDWYIALLYGLGSGLAANGIADTGLIQWIIGLFASKK